MSPTSSSAAPSSTSSQASDPGPTPLLSSQSALYLYTFLVTLILLLVVSGAIVTRSYFMRRRHRLMVEEAIRNGTYVPPDAKKKTLGERPVLHDAYLDAARWEEHRARYVGEGGGGTHEKLQWEDVLPVSVAIQSPAGRFNASPAAAQVPHPAAVDAQTRQRFSWLPVRFRRQSPTNDASDTPSSPSEKDPTPPISQDAQPQAQVPVVGRVVVIIAMPRPPGFKIASQQSDAELPHVEFGIAEVTVRGLDEAEADQPAGS